MDVERHFKDMIKYKINILKYLPDKKNVQDLARVVAFSLTAYYVMKKIYTGFFGPLVRIPGPFISRFIKSPSIKHTLLNGKRYKHIKELHEKYGHVVRLSPDSISVTDKHIIKTVLVTKDLPKSPLYDFISGKSARTMFTTRDKAFHRQRRRSASPAFSIKYLVSLESYMATVTCSLVDQIAIDIEKSKDTEGYGTVDLWSLMQRFALDIIGETAFGQTFDMIKNNSHFVPGAIKKELKIKVFSSLFPFLTRVFLPASRKSHPYIHSFVEDIIAKRVNNKDNTRKDILQAFIDSQNEPDAQDRLSDEAIIAEVGLLLSAGSETTGSTLGFTIIELLKNPDKLKKLYEEIDEIPLEEGQKVHRHDQLKNLPYLNAVIHESLRLHSAIAIGFPRITDKDIILNDQLTVPAGITIMVNQYRLQRSADYWEEPNSFIPERWISGEECHVKAADPDAFYTFSGGTRTCIGKNFSLQEMRLALSAVIKHYELMPIEQELKNSEDQIVYLTLMLKSNSFKVKVKQREEQ